MSGPQLIGLEEVLAELENRLGEAQMTANLDRALKAGAEVFKTELLRQLETFKVSGATIEELTFSEPMWLNGERVIKVFWRGPKRRYAVIHLNELGTVRNPKPRGKGKIALALRNSERAYVATVRSVLEGSV